MSNQPGSADFQYQTGEYYQPPVNQPQMAPSTVDPNYPQQQYEKSNDYYGSNIDENIEQSMRRGFIVKTYGILLSQLFITLCFIFLGFNEAVFNSIMHNWDLHRIFLVISLVIMITILFMFFCCRETTKQVPLNYILLFGYTLCMSYYLLLLTTLFEPITVVFALGLTIMSTVGLTVYACKTKTDYTFCGFFLFSFLFALIFCGIFFPVGIYTGIGFNATYGFYTIIGIFIYSIYLIYDTQLILGEFGLSYNVDDYVIAALNLYIDIIYLFIKILQIVGKLRGS